MDRHMSGNGDSKENGDSRLERLRRRAEVSRAMHARPDGGEAADADEGSPPNRARAERLSLSVVIPTLNAAAVLPETIASLGSAARRGIDVELIVVDGGSSDDTLAVARELGATIVEAPRGRGSQLAAGAKVATGDWLMFLHADTRLDRGWDASLMVFSVDRRNREKAAVFTFSLDDEAPAARRIERLVRVRNDWIGLPYGDQGLVLQRRFYRQLGGYADLPLMEDVHLMRRIGSRRIVRFDVRAITSAERYRRGGWIARPIWNLCCLTLYFLRVPPRWIARLYG